MGSPVPARTPPVSEFESPKLIKVADVGLQLLDGMNMAREMTQTQKGLFSFFGSNNNVVLDLDLVILSFVSLFFYLFIFFLVDTEID